MLSTTNEVKETNISSDNEMELNLKGLQLDEENSNSNTKEDHVRKPIHLEETNEEIKETNEKKEKRVAFAERNSLDITERSSLQVPRKSLSSITSPSLTKLICTLQKYGYHLELMNDTTFETQRRIQSSDALSSLEDTALTESTEPITSPPHHPSTLESPYRASTSNTSRLSVTSMNTTTSLLNLRERKNYQTALHIAVKKGHLNVIQALAHLPYIKELLNIQDRHLNTALHFVAASTKSNAIEMCKLLLQLGAQPDLYNIRHLIPLASYMLTCKQDNIEMVRLLLQAMQCEVNKEEATIKLQRNLPITVHPSLNEICCNGKTMVHYMIEKNFQHIAVQLIIAGASLNIPDQEGKVISDQLPKKTLVGYIKYMNEGQQAPPAEVARGGYCRICRLNGTSFKDCYLCGRSICKKCSKKKKNIMKHLKTSQLSPRKVSIKNPLTIRQSLGSVLSPRKNGSSGGENGGKKERYCQLCITILIMDDRKTIERQHFNEQFRGI